MSATQAAEDRAATTLRWTGSGTPLAGGLLVAVAHAALLWAVLGLTATQPPIAPLPRPVMLTLVPSPPGPQPAPEPEPALKAPVFTAPRPDLPPLPQIEVGTPARPAAPAVASAPAAEAAAPASDGTQPHVHAVAATPAAAPPLRTLSADALGFTVAPVLRYPALSRRLGEQGRVLLRVRIDGSGVPVELSIATSSGHPRLDQAALDAARLARLRPLIEDGVASAAWVLLPFVFRLENS